MLGEAVLLLELIHAVADLVGVGVGVGLGLGLGLRHLLHAC